MSIPRDCSQPYVLFGGFLFVELVELELAQARKKHAAMTSLHHGYAVMLEEVEEFWAEVKKRKEQRDPRELLKELVQIGAMAQRLAEDCEHYFKPLGDCVLDVTKPEGGAS